MYRIGVDGLNGVPGSGATITSAVTAGAALCPPGYESFVPPSGGKAVCVPTSKVQSPSLTAPAAMMLRNTSTSIPAPSATPKPVLEGGRLVCPSGFYLVDPIGRTAACLPNNISSQPVVPCPEGSTVAYQSTPVGYARLCIAGEGSLPSGTSPTASDGALPPLPQPTKTPWLWLGLGAAAVAVVGGLVIAVMKK